MDILLIGGFGTIAHRIIDKFNKEGHRVYVLSGKRYAIDDYRSAYETYHFNYDEGCINDIFMSIQPDITIFMGAYDVNFVFGQEANVYVTYLAGLVNSLISFTMLNKGKFIYLSSEEVFARTASDDIREDEPQRPDSIKGIALAQGEILCSNYYDMGFDITVLRIDHMVYIPDHNGEIIEICASLCREALRSGKISIEHNDSISMLFFLDALEALYRIAVAQDHKHCIYHISSQKVINLMEIARLIADNMKEIRVLSDDSVSGTRRVLDSCRFTEEFSLEVRHSPADIINKITRAMSKKKEFLPEADMSKGGKFKSFFHSINTTIKILIPYIENVIGFILFFFLHNRAADSRFLSTIDLYFVYVLLFAIVYGQNQAILSALLAVGGYWFYHMKAGTSFSLLTDYNFYLWIGQLFIIGLVVGYMKDRLNIVKKAGELEVKYLSGQLYDIKDINESNSRIKNILGLQILNQSNSLGKLYEVISDLDQYETEEVLFRAAEVLAKLMGTKDAAIYTVANQSYARLVSATSNKARELGNSIQYTAFDDMYGDLQKRKVFINKQLIEGRPLMAYGIYSEDRMLLIVMIWGIPWERMTLSQANMLTIIGSLIQNAVVRANRYMEALQNQRYMEETGILEESAFRSLIKAYLSASGRGLTLCTLLKVEVMDKEYAQAAKVLLGKLRNIDYLGRLSDDNIYVLLSNTNENDAAIVMQRFAEAGYSSSIYKEADV